MTGLSSLPEAERPRVLARLLADLGTVRGAENALVIGPASALEAVQAELEPRRADADADFGSGAAASSGHDLIVAFEGVAAGGLGEVRDRIGALRDRLAAHGRLALVVPTLAGAAVFRESDDGLGGQEALLFPHLAASGELGETPGVQLAASSWLLLARACGLEAEAVYGLGRDGVPDRVAEEHAGRLAAFDSLELRTGWLMMLLGVGEAEA